MAKKDMSLNEQILFIELKTLAKRANQRLLRLERLTGEKGTFASKQLYDYLEVVNGISKTGRIRVSKSLSETEMLGIIRATKQFLKSGTSTQRGVKKKVKEYSTKAGKPISFKQADVLYKSEKNYTWIYQFIPKSEFWDIVRVAKRENWDEKTFAEQISFLGKFEIDEELKQDLESLYYYVME